MTLKDLIMQTSFEEVVVEYKKLLHSHGYLYTEREKKIVSIIFEKLRTMEPVENENMTIWAGRHNVNGCETGNPYPYSLAGAPWKDWLGMEIDADLLKNVRHAAIIVNCFWEMSYWGIEEDNESFSTIVDGDEEANCDNSESVDSEEDSYHLSSDPLESVDMDICKIRDGVAIIHEGITEIPDKYFRGLLNLKSVIIPDSVIRIGQSAFESCEGLVSITIPSSVTSIGYGAFSDCDNLESVEIPDSVTDIEAYAFCGCENLTKIRIPDNVTLIGKCAFEDCIKLSEFVLPHSLSIIYYCMPPHVSSIFIPSSITEIVDHSFSNSDQIVVAEDNEIYDSRDNCNAIIETATNCLVAGCKATVIPNTVTEIFDRAFLECNGLEEIVIPESVTEIGWFAFANCKRLISIALLDSVKMIWPRAFDGCDSLKSIIVPSGSAERFKKMLPEELHDKIKEK